MGMFDELKNQRESREAKARAVLEGQTLAEAASSERSQRADARAESEFAALDKMVTRVLWELRAAAYPECEVRKDVPRLRWLLGIELPTRRHDATLFDPVIVVAPLYDADGSSARLQCESTFAAAFRERRARGRVERTADLSPEALAEALRKLHRR